MKPDSVSRVQLNQNDGANQFDVLWKHFRTGHWAKLAPIEPGVYPVAARDGGFRGYVTVREMYSGIGRRFCPVYIFEQRMSVDPNKIHAGWWWTRALPPMPSADRWLDERRTG